MMIDKKDDFYQTTMPIKCGFFDRSRQKSTENLNKTKINLE